MGVPSFQETTFIQPFDDKLTVKFDHYAAKEANKPNTQV
jgi:hypothetical protein